MRLNELQSRFVEILLDVPAALDTPDPAFAAELNAGNIPVPERLRVYRNNIMGTVAGALAANYPMIEKLVGGEFLNPMTRSYVLAHPPKSGHLTLYGADFNAFIATYPPAKDLPYLPDMARLETAMAQSYNARDEYPLTIQDMAKIPEDKIADFPLKRREAAHIIKSPWPLDKIMALCRGENGQDRLDIRSGGVCLLVHRPHLDVEIATISEPDYFFLHALETTALGESVAKTIESHPDFNFQKTLSHLMNLKIFLKDPPP